ncbi:MAG: hypothetical protein R2838_26135 [Caldilineaceae bacterium]
MVTMDGYKFVMDDGGWLLIRFSGTEPLLRAYTETTGRRRPQSWPTVNVWPELLERRELRVAGARRTRFRSRNSPPAI